MSDKNSWDSMKSDVGTAISAIVFGGIFGVISLIGLAFLLIKLFG